MRALKALRLVPFADRQSLPRNAGVYFIFHDGLLIYVGESGNILTRCGYFSHEIYRRVRIREKIQIGFIVRRDVEQRRALEDVAIATHRPIYNMRVRNTKPGPKTRNGQPKKKRK